MAPHVERPRELLRGHGAQPELVVAAPVDELQPNALQLQLGRPAHFVEPHDRRIADLDPALVEDPVRKAAAIADLARDPRVLAEVQKGVDEINEQFARVENIRKFTLLGEEWLPDTDLLTPTQKLKRRGILARYAEQIEAMYA